MKEEMKSANKSRKPIHKGINKPKNIHKAWRCSGNGLIHSAANDYERYGGYISNLGFAKIGEE